MERSEEFASIAIGHHVYVCYYFDRAVMEKRHAVIAYPPAPWTLGGWGIATIGLVDSTAAAAFVPAGLRLVTVAPGKTFGGLFFLSYDRGSLTYRELNVVAGLVRIGRRFAFWLPRLYVDSEASLAGGRAIWGVDKELATFAIGHAGDLTSIDVRQRSRLVCSITTTTSLSGVRLRMPLPSIGVRDDAFLFFTGTLRSRFALAHAAIDLPPGGEFAALGLDRPRVALHCADLTLAVPAPRVVLRVV